MVEQDRQDIGDGEDNFSDAAQNIQKAAKGDGQQGAENSGGENSAPKDTGNNSNAANPQSPGGDAGSSGPAGSEAGANTGPVAGSNTTAPQSAGAGNNPVGAGVGQGQAPQAGNAGNLVSQKGLETGANQAAQAGAAGASAAQAGAAAGAQAAQAGAEAAATAAAASVKAGVEAGAAVAEIAAGTATGGPWGAIIMAAWSLRHTLFKILIFICLFLMFFIALIVNLPSIMFNYVFRTDPASVGVTASYNIFDIFDELSAVVAESVTEGYDHALAEVDRIIANGGYDRELSMQALINHGATSAEYDISYVLSAYSVSMEQRGTSRQDMVSKLRSVKDQMFPVTYEVREITVTIPPEDEDGEPTTEIVRYIAATIHPFDQSVILRAFQIDVNAQYNQFTITNGQAIHNMTSALKATMFGSFAQGSVPPITDAELAAFIANLDVCQMRKDLVTAALSLVGRVPYFWGGKSGPGWNEAWNTPRLVTSLGSSSTGTIRPFGLDCSGFTDWVYKTALGVSLVAGSWSQWDNSTAITLEELLPGDLGFMAAPGTVPINHVLIFAGWDASGNMLWAHSTGGRGVVLDSPTYVRFYRRATSADWEDCCNGR